MSKGYYERCFTSFSTSIKAIRTIEEYHGEKVIQLNCTQLSEAEYPKLSQRKKILNDWIDFLRNHPDALEIIYCETRMNQQLFDAICCQKSLTELHIKWGVYPDLSKITNLQQLECLTLCAGASAKDITPIGELEQLEALSLSTVGVQDYSPLERLHGLKELGIHSGMENLIKVNDLKFMYQLKELRNFSTSGFRLNDGDYSPVLSLSKLERLCINMPTYDYNIWKEKLVKCFSDIAYNNLRNPVCFE